MNMQTVKLNNGVEMPVLGFGGYHRQRLNNRGFCNQTEQQIKCLDKSGKAPGIYPYWHLDEKTWLKSQLFNNLVIIKNEKSILYFNGYFLSTVNNYKCTGGKKNVHI
jgi:hypothetical protein